MLAQKELSGGTLVNECILVCNSFCLETLLTINDTMNKFPVRICILPETGKEQLQHFIREQPALSIGNTDNQHQFDQISQKGPGTITSALMILTGKDKKEGTSKGLRKIRY